MRRCPHGGPWSPATPKTNAPVQPDLTYFVEPALLPTKLQYSCASTIPVRRTSSSCGLIFRHQSGSKGLVRRFGPLWRRILALPACNNLEYAIRRWSLEHASFRPERRTPRLAFLFSRQDHRHRSEMKLAPAAFSKRGFQRRCRKRKYLSGKRSTDGARRSCNGRVAKVLPLSSSIGLASAC